METIDEARQVNAEYQEYLRRKVSAFIPKAYDLFPGAQPVSFLRRHLDQLTRQDFYVSEKSDGTRYLVFIHCLPLRNHEEDGCNKDGPASSKFYQECFLIDRKNVYYHFPYMFPSSGSIVSDNVNPWLDNTLIDGELVIDTYIGSDGSEEIVPRFLAFDLLLLEGNDYRDRTFSKRLGYLKTFVLDPLHKYQKTNTTAKENPCMSMEMKKIELCYGMDKVWATVGDLKHGNDGLIFTANDSPYTLGTCEAMVKWKPPELNSVDFKVRVTMEGGVPKFMLDIAANGAKRYKSWGELKNPPSEDWIRSPETVDGKIAECTYDANLDTHWVFMRFRLDKSEPNHESVVPKIMKSIKEESVSSKELLDSVYLNSIKSNWKARAHQ